MKKKAAAALSFCLAASAVFALSACGGGGEGSTAVSDDIVNGDFEQVEDGKWVGWTREDAAFNFRGVVSDEKIGGAPMEKSGEYYFAGPKGGNPPMRGTLTSPERTRRRSMSSSLRRAATRPSPGWRMKTATAFSLRSTS